MGGGVGGDVGVCLGFTRLRVNQVRVSKLQALKCYSLGLLPWI